MAQTIEHRTLKSVKNNKGGQLIDVNVLDYVTILINYLAAIYFLCEMNYFAIDPHSIVLLRGDNTASESWAKKGSKHSPMGQALGCLQCALMLDNQVGLKLLHISARENVIADKISRVESESDFPRAFLDLCQKHLALIGCH